jgi:hypothetical protein
VTHDVNDVSRLPVNLLRAHWLNQFGATNMMRLPALLALVAVSTTGCAQNMRGAAIVTGIATTVAGGFVAKSGAVDANGDGINENPFDDNWGDYLIGGLLVAAGLGITCAGLVGRDEDPAPVAAQRVVYAPQPMAYAPQSMAYAPQPMAYAPQPMAYAPQPGRATLPELATNSEALRDAQQIRSLAESRQCAAAWTMWHRLDANDHAYAIAVRDGAVMAPCPVNVVAPMP